MSDASSRLGTFQLLKQLGGSGPIEAWLAQPAAGGARVLLRRARRDDLGEVAGAFFAEAKRRAAVVHPHISRVVAHGEQEGWCFVASEHVDGVTLQQLLRRLQEKGGVMPPVLACKIAVAVGQALAHVLAVDPSALHRDLTPHAVVLGIRGEIKLLDLGAALPGAALTSAGTVLRRFVYQSPEQAKDYTPDPRSNVFSLGVLLYEMLAGTNPFARSTPVECLDALSTFVPADVAMVRPGLGAVDPVLRRALAKEPEQRQADAGELAAELEMVLESRRLPASTAELAQYVAGVVEGRVGAEAWTEVTRIDEHTVTDVAAIGDLDKTTDPDKTRIEAAPQELAPIGPRPRSQAWWLAYVGAWAMSALITFGAGRSISRPRQIEPGPVPASVVRAPAPVPVPVEVPPRPPAPAAEPEPEPLAVAAPEPEPQRPKRVEVAGLGTVRIKSAPALPLFLDGKRVRSPIVITENQGEITLGSRNHPFILEVRYRITGKHMELDLDSTPWAMVLPESGLSLGRTPVEEIDVSQASLLRIANPAEKREVSLAIQWVPRR